MRHLLRVVLAAIVLPFTTVLQARASEPASDYYAAETSESPYFELTRGEITHFPLKSTKVTASIAGVIADVQIEQTYQNTSDAPIEATYVFPGSTRAAVYGLTMEVDGRIVHAKIKEKEEAKKIYQEAVKQGKTASLLVQTRPNVFKMKLGNVIPGDEIKVTLKYTELLVAEEGEYQFVFPTVVGPRYAGGTDKEGAGESWVGNPHLNEGEKALETFDLSVQLNTGLPLQEAKVDTHKTDVSYTGKNSATFTLQPSERHGSNRDFILRYRLAGQAVESGLLLYEGGEAGENFFLAMIQPPARIAKESVVAREFIFVVDVSGSMNGFPIETAKNLAKDLFGRLTPADRFNLLLFAGGSEVLSAESLPASAANVRKAVQFLDKESGGGGTELLPALRRAFALPAVEGVSRSVVVITDGMVTVETEAFDLVRSNLSKCNVYSFGIGSSVNRFIIEGLAKAGMGEPFVVEEPGQAKEVSRRFREYIESPVLTGITHAFTGFDAYDIVPVSIPDVLAHRPVLVFGKYRGEASGGIELKGTAGNGPWSAQLLAENAVRGPGNSALRYLWARHRVRELQDYYELKSSGELRQEVVNLGLTYNLLTPFTSFVAVDEVIRNPGGETNPVKQPLPLPQGMNNNAVGYNGVPGTPEPETWVLMTVVGAFLLRLWFRKRKPHA